MKNKSILLALAGLVLIPTATSCKKEEVKTLIIYNWEDYIYEGDDEDPGTIDRFIKYYEETYGEKINVEYYTFETNENMLNVIKTGKSHYDLVCPSDYTIQKMIKEDMLEPIDKTHPLTNYEQNASPYIQEIFAKNKLTVNGKEVSWADYSIPFFWGTMGFMYDPEIIPEEATRSWGLLVDPEYKGLATVKDSVRDTYCAGVLYSYANTKNALVGYSLNELKQMYANGDISASSYTEKIQTIMNDTSDETLELVKNNLKKMKENSYGFEVDSGKADIVTGKIAMNFCWSGDAVYAMDCAEEENDVYLNYQVPEEGSNVWFDGWVMPKGANVELAQEFLNFISQPEIAALNMNEVGYSNSIAGDAIYDMTVEWYGSSQVYEFDEDGCLVSTNLTKTDAEIQELLDNKELYAYDLSYFFGDTIDSSKSSIIYSDEINRQFSAQFPDKETLIRCAVMEDFGERNLSVLEMWTKVKSNEVPTWAYIFVAIVVIAIGYGLLSYYFSKKIRKNRINEKKKAA